MELPEPFVAETERHDAGIAGEVAPFFVASDLNERCGLCVRREPNAPAELDQIPELDGRVERPDEASGAGSKRCRRDRTRRVEEELDPGVADAEDGKVRPVVIVTGGPDRGQRPKRRLGPARPLTGIDRPRRFSGVSRTRRIWLFVGWPSSPA